MDAAEVGKYGTLRLMKRNEPNVSIAAFPVDDEVVTFGRDPDCSVRLYYAWVSSVHCKIIFEENKVRIAILQHLMSCTFSYRHSCKLLVQMVS